MSVLEQARAVYARLKAERNGRAEPPIKQAQSYAINAVNAKSTPGYQPVRDQAGLDTVTAALENTVQVGLDLETTGLDPPHRPRSPVVPGPRHHRRRNDRLPG